MKGLHIQIYLAEVQQKIADDFEDVVIEHIPCSLNAHADALARLASATTAGIDHPITIEVISKLRPLVEVFEIPEDNWMKPIHHYLTTGQIPDEVKDQCGFQLKSARYTILDGSLYKRGFSDPLLHCIDPHTTKEMLEEFHEGTCETHEGPRALASRILYYGYYWPRMHQDVKDFVSRCDKCQRFSIIGKCPMQPLQPIVSMAPFERWGLDFIGPFPTAS